MTDLVACWQPWPATMITALNSLACSQLLLKRVELSTP